MAWRWGQDSNLRGLFALTVFPPEADPASRDKTPFGGGGRIRTYETRKGLTVFPAPIFPKLVDLRDPVAWRWEEDSNFRGLFALLVFKTSAIDHSAIPPPRCGTRPSLSTTQPRLREFNEPSPSSGVLPMGRTS